MEPKPVFISVLYRSGSTVLLLALNQSKELKFTYDDVHFMRFSYNKYNPVDENYEQLVNDTKKRIFDRTQKEIDVKSIIENIQKHDKITQAVVYDEIMKSYLAIGGNERWGDRTAVKWSGISEFLEMFPEGKVIHIYRDPRAVLASYKYYTYHKGEMYLDAIFASLSMFNYIEREDIVKNENVYLLKYEDLVSNPEAVMKDVCDFLDIEFIDSMLDVASFKDKKGELFDANSSFTGRRSGIDKSTIDKWKTKLSNVEIHLCEKVLKDKMLKHGYTLSGIELDGNESQELEALIQSDFLGKRYKYWLKHGDGQEAYPDTKGAYDE